MKDHDEDSATNQEPVSKSARKRAVAALQDQGRRLAGLGNRELGNLPLWPELREAVDVARRIPSSSARERQIRYIARLLQAEEAQPVLAALARMDEDHAAELRRFHQLEILRDQLLDAADPLALVLPGYPQVERSRLMQLVREARAERDRSGPPTYRRKLFRYLRELAEFAG